MNTAIHIKKDKTTWSNFQSMSATYKRIRIAYIESARNRPEEFEKRLKNFVDKTRKNKLIPGFGGIDKYYWCMSGKTETLQAILQAILQPLLLPHQVASSSKLSKEVALLPHRSIRKTEIWKNFSSHYKHLSNFTLSHIIISSIWYFFLDPDATYRYTSASTQWISTDTCCGSTNQPPNRL